jgi:predicted metalloendopeptidase
MDGQLTMGENLADLGGLSLACQVLNTSFRSAYCPHMTLLCVDNHID